jgi:alkylation response protein AidB-like acyl-CoA dehydrogenase
VTASPLRDLVPENAYRADPALRSALAAMLPEGVLAWAEPKLDEVGALARTIADWGDECERQPARLLPVEPWGDRVDEVVYPDAWWRLKAAAARTGCVALPYEQETRRVAGAEGRVVHAALSLLFEPQAATYFCPVAMTDAAARVLVEFGPDELRERYLPHFLARDPAAAWTAGQWMTEQQGGSDVGANRVEARREGGGWRLYGRKFFCSNVGGEVVLALARPEGAGPGTRGLGLFAVPRRLPDGRRNDYRVDRLKDKLGTRAMATGEVTLEGARAQQIGELERGFAQMTPMLNITRLHNAISSAAGMRRGLLLARAYAARRSAFGKPLEEQPLHRAVLTELAADGEACLLLVLRLAQLLGKVEQREAAPDEELLFRVGTSLTKLYTAKRAVAAASEVVESFGGPGYMEDTGVPRFLRDAQVLPIWEGTTNVLSLDTLRVLAKPGVAAAFDAELERLESPGRARAEKVLRAVSEAGAETGQRGARALAFTLAEAWVGGLLREAAGRGRREAAVQEAWQRRGELNLDDLFDEVVDGQVKVAASS